MKKTVYYAHPMSLYNTKQEARDIVALEEMGFEVINPNQPAHDVGYQGSGMAYFRDLVKSVDVLVFRSFSDGAIPAGVAHEIKEARANGTPVLELPTGVFRRTMNVEETRERLRDNGYR
jgi:hypothetical protein